MDHQAPAVILLFSNALSGALVHPIVMRWGMMDEELRNALASDYFVSLTNEGRLWRLKFVIEKKRGSATSELIDGDLDNLFARWIDFERKISEGANEEEVKS